MKKLLTLVLALVTIFMFTGCLTEPLVLKESDTFIVIKVSDEQMEITDSTKLLDYMTSLKEGKTLEFEIDDGMILSINGIDNPVDWSSCWMLYTSDEDNANAGWGTVEYDGKTYGSAIVGADDLIVKNDCLYIWVFESFN